MAMKHGTIKSLDESTQTGIIAGEKDSIVVFDASDLRGVPFSDLKKKMPVLYSDLIIAREDFRDALRVVVADDVPMRRRSRRANTGMIRSWNRVEGIGILVREDGSSVVFSESALDESFRRRRPRPGMVVEYDDHCLHGRRVATSIASSRKPLSRSGVTAAEMSTLESRHPSAAGLQDVQPAGQGEEQPDPFKTGTVTNINKTRRTGTIDDVVSFKEKALDDGVDFNSLMGKLVEYLVSPENPSFATRVRLPQLRQ